MIIVYTLLINQFVYEKSLDFSFEYSYIIIIIKILNINLYL